ncbi:MAG: ribosomal RNA small subunit methyltransferase A [Acidobacteria bacterium]|nr:MAG: ribosomal RNA small subunit methyltransferase A [Acidobacteriota bacterium]
MSFREAIEREMAKQRRMQLATDEGRWRARKRFGQHFLEPAWADKVVDAIAPLPDDRFLEIGPGPGILTTRLASRVRELTAIEIDRDLAARLTPSLPPNARMLVADVLSVDLAPMTSDGPLRVAGNLPYYVSSPIIFKLIESARRTRAIPDATVMLQLEVAERLIATVGTADYGVLAILTQLHADVTRVLTLPPGAFRPMPKVRSAVVRLAFRPPAVDIGDQTTFERLVRTIFTQRRKTILNALRPFAEPLGRDPASALARAGIDSRRRPETLDLRELAALAQRLHEA